MSGEAKKIVSSKKQGSIAIGSDHGGFALKEDIKIYLGSLGYTVKDVGTHSADACDYPDFAKAVAKSVQSGEASHGIMIDGMGIGSSMVCNKVPGIRAALCWDEKSAVSSKKHNNANVLTLGANANTACATKALVNTWLSTDFEGGRHLARVEKIETSSTSAPHGLGSPSLGKYLNKPEPRTSGAFNSFAKGTGAAPANYDTKIAAMIDHTLLKPEATEDQIEELCREAIQYKFCSVCVNPSWVSKCAKLLRNTGVKVCTVVGFPLGAMDGKAKAFEAREAIANGADEIDMVINVGALKSRRLDIVEQDIRVVKQATRNRICKVILETSLLTDEEKVIASELAKKANADFVKTSTGFGKHGATVADVALMRKTVGQHMGVKASGGVRDANDAKKMIEAGATRLGTSGGVAIVSGGTGKGY